MQSKRNFLSLEEKKHLMPDVMMALDIVLSLKESGITDKLTKQVADYGDNFLNLCYAIIVNGYEPKLAKHVLFNFANSEGDFFKHKKMLIYADVILAAQEPWNSNTYLNTVALHALSHLGWDFKDDFIEIIRQGNDRLYKANFEYSGLNCSGDFLCLNVYTRQSNS